MILPQSLLADNILCQIVQQVTLINWQLCPHKFRDICQVLGRPDIDLFATTLNEQLPRYVAWKPDPGAETVDAFVQSWGTLLLCIFPPFNLISRALKKIESERAKAIVIVPFWPTQPWFPSSSSCALTRPMLFPADATLSSIIHVKTRPNSLWGSPSVSF